MHSYEKKWKSTYSKYWNKNQKYLEENVCVLRVIDVSRNKILIFSIHVTYSSNLIFNEIFFFHLYSPHKTGSLNH